MIIFSGGEWKFVDLHFEECRSVLALIVWHRSTKSAKYENQNTNSHKQKRALNEYFYTFSKESLCVLDGGPYEQIPYLLKISIPDFASMIPILRYRKFEHFRMKPFELFTADFLSSLSFLLCPLLSLL